MKEKIVLNGFFSKVKEAEKTASRRGESHPGTEEIAAIAGCPPEWVEEIKRIRWTVKHGEVREC